jgi:predicted Zn-ribbon and HTH transcriptional regulator
MESDERMDKVYVQCHKCQWFGDLTDLRETIYCPKCDGRWPWEVRFMILLQKFPTIDFICHS